MSHMEAPATRRWLRCLELAGVALLVLAALYPRARDLHAGFDRGSEGFQGAFFAVCAVNYERLGLGALEGYPVASIDVDAERPNSWYVYANHPPFVPLLAWAGARALGPEGWDQAWREGRAPEGLEAALRAPFLILSLIALLALWWALREGEGPRVAMTALALIAALPLASLHATLVNYENPALCFVLLGAAAHARSVRLPAGRARRLWLCILGACFALAGCVTYTPLMFAGALCIERLAARAPRAALRTALVAGGGALAPLLIHAQHASSALAALGQPPDTLLTRARRLLAPLLDGQVPLHSWAAHQMNGALELFSAPLVVAAALGLLWACLRPRESQRARLALPLLLGGLLTHLAFFQHTADTPRQDVFFLNLAPGVCALAAVAVERAARLFSRGGAGPIVALCGALVLPAVLRTEDLRWRWRAPGPRDDAALTTGPEGPLPRSVGAELAKLLPAGEVGLYPGALGLNIASYYYAWRTLRPLDPATGAGPAFEWLERYGLGDAPVWLLLPNDPPPSALPGCEALRALFAERLPELAAGTPDASTRSFQAWRLRP